MANAYRDSAEKWFVVVTAGNPPYAHAVFFTRAAALRWIMAHGMRAVAWVEQW
jgi:hypothetical protein